MLAVPLERYYFLTDSVYTGAEWLTRPWVLVFIAVLVAPLVLGLVKRIRARRKIDADDGHHQAPIEEEGELAGSVWSLATAAGMLVVFAVGWLMSGEFSADARLMPRLVCTAGMIVAAVLLATEIRRHRRTPVDAAPGPGLTPAVRTAATTFAWMSAFLALVVLGGYLAALLLFVPAFLLWVARARPRTVVVYTVAAAVLIVLLPALLPVDLPIGLLALS